MSTWQDQGTSDDTVATTEKMHSLGLCSAIWVKNTKVLKNKNGLYYRNLVVPKILNEEILCFLGRNNKWFKGVKIDGSGFEYYLETTYVMLQNCSQIKKLRSILDYVSFRRIVRICSLYFAIT